MSGISATLACNQGRLRSVICASAIKSLWEGAPFSQLVLDAWPRQDEIRSRVVIWHKKLRVPVFSEVLCRLHILAATILAHYTTTRAREYHEWIRYRKHGVYGRVYSSLVFKSEYIAQNWWRTTWTRGWMNTHERSTHTPNTHIKKPLCICMSVRKGLYLVESLHSRKFRPMCLHFRRCSRQASRVAFMFLLLWTAPSTRSLMFVSIIFCQFFIVLV